MAATDDDSTVRRNTALVIGVGNEFRHDDAAGIAVANRIAALTLPRVNAVVHSGEGVSLLERFGEADTVIIIDAAQSSSTPGLIYRFDAARVPIPSDFFNYSTHAFSVAEAVELARALGRLPERLVVYGIEGADFSAGNGLTQSVVSAVNDVVARVMNDLNEMAFTETV